MHPTMLFVLLLLATYGSCQPFFDIHVDSMWCDVPQYTPAPHAADTYCALTMVEEDAG